MDAERVALWISATIAIAIGLAALALGLISGSSAILLDSAFNISFFAAAVLTLRIVTLLRRPDDAKYPFGYIQFEPLINLVKGLLILGTGLIAFIDGILTLISGGQAIEAGLALYYAIGAVAACGLAVVSLRRASGRAHSPLVAADLDNWTVNALITAAMGGAFLVALLLQSFGMNGAARYVDPLFVCAVVAFTAPVPIRIVWRSIRALIHRAPDDGTDADIKARAIEALGDTPTVALHVRAIRPGRSVYALLHVVLPEGATLDVGVADVLRAKIISALTSAYEGIVADVVFTADPVFADPAAANDPAYLARLRDIAGVPSSAAATPQ